MSPNPPGRLYEVAARQRAALLRGERQAASELVRAYGGVWQRIQARLDALWQARAAAEAAGGAVGDSWLYQFNRLDTLQRQVEAELRTFAEFADPLITRQQGVAVDAALQHSEELVRTLTNQAGVSVGWARLPTSAIEDLIGFTANGSPLRELLDALGPAASTSVRDALIQGLALGRGPAAVAREIRQALGGNVARALTISRTETLRAYREATRRSYEANSDVVDGWVWNCACTERSCALCWAMHGSVHPNTESLNDHPNGQCSMVPHVKDFPGMAQQTLPEAGPAQFARLTPAQQDGILGKAAGRAYRGGAFKLEDVVGRTFDPDWGPGFRVKSLRELVGQEEAGKWKKQVGREARWRTGHDDLLVEIERIAANHRVLVDHDGIIGVAEILSQALQDFGHDEWLPREIRVDLDQFSPTERISVIGRYARKGRVLFLNPEHPYWQGGLIGAKEYMADLIPGYLSTDTDLHPFWHEFGHSAHHRVLRSRYDQWAAAPWAGAERQVGLQVSRRAMVSRYEFMAEAFALLKAGKQLSPDAEAMYVRFGGLIP